MNGMTTRLVAVDDAPELAALFAANRRFLATKRSCGGTFVTQCGFHDVVNSQETNMSKLLMGVAAAALVIGLGGAASAQSQAPSSSSATTTKENVPGGGDIGTNRPAASPTTGAAKSAQPPEGEEGTRRPGQQAPSGNAPVAR